MNIEERVLKTVSSTFNVGINEISVSDTKDDIESWDSIGHLQLIMGLEYEFNIKFKTSEIAEIASIADCINIVYNLTNNK